MKFRIARHTDSLEKMIAFYVDVLGLQVLGSFEDHDGYNGIFLGLPNHDWHLEFTVSSDGPVHAPDEDDLTVFYVQHDEYKVIQERLATTGLNQLQAKNPYWHINGITIQDPDGYRVVISKARQ